MNPNHFINTFDNKDRSFEVRIKKTNKELLNHHAQHLIIYIYCSNTII